MKIGVIILCRHDSSRLPGKILREIQGKPILQYIYERLLVTLPAEKIVVATSSEPSDDPIESFCHKHKVQIFRGSKNNVAERFLNCAITYQFDYCIRVNGDNLFTDSKILKEILNSLDDGKYDFVSNVKGRTFPHGMSIEAVKREFYQQAIEKFDKPEYLEHVTLYFYEHPNYGCQLHITNKNYPQASGINLAIDTQDDFEFARRLISNMQDYHTTYHLRNILDLIEDTKNQ